MSLANGIFDLACGAGILLRRRFWRALAAIAVGTTCGSQLAELLYQPTIATLILLSLNGLVLWTLTDRRAHLAMRG